MPPRRSTRQVPVSKPVVNVVAPSIQRKRAANDSASADATKKPKISTSMILKTRPVAQRSTSKKPSKKSSSVEHCEDEPAASIDFETGQSVAPNIPGQLSWEDDAAGQLTAKRQFFVFRLAGSTSLSAEVKSPRNELTRTFTTSIAPSSRKYGLPKNRVFECWNNEGEPGQTGPMLVTVGRLLKAAEANRITFTDEDTEFLKVLESFVRPTSAWKTPLVCVKADSIVIDNDKPFQVRLHVYFSRLIFYLIASEDLKILMDRLTPAGKVVAKVHDAPDRPHVLNSQSFIESKEYLDQQARLETFNKESQVEIAKLKKKLAAIKRKTTSSASTGSQPFTPFAWNDEWQIQQVEDQIEDIRTNIQTSKERHENAHLFSLDGVLKKAESRGYAMATQPSSVQLTMKEYQRMSLQFMMDAEKIEGGINRYFWETREWKDGGKFFYSPLLGEVRIGCDEPPEIHGGLLCDEMGMGKTLVVAALLAAEKEAHMQATKHATKHGHGNTRQDPVGVQRINSGGDYAKSRSPTPSSPSLSSSSSLSPSFSTTTTTTTDETSSASSSAAAEITTKTFSLKSTSTLASPMTMLSAASTPTALTLK
eukprot:m.124191 g.124191  ORF g.124191 m.124191 type:complete len:593 (-) comp29043_c5_seq1:291-2069(-)